MFHSKKENLFKSNFKVIFVALFLAFAMLFAGNFLLTFGSQKVADKTVFAADSQAGNVYTVDLTAKNYSNQQSITTVNHSYTGVFTVTFATGNGTNDPKYYTSGTSVRTYSNNTLTIAPTKDYKITAISFTMYAQTSRIFWAYTLLRLLAPI